MRSTSRNPQGSRWLRLVERLLLVAGILLMGFLVYQLDAAEVIGNLRLVGWGILLTIGQEGIAIAFNALGWWYAFTSPKPAIPFAKLLAARLAGDAVNYLTPTASIGGELVRTRLLHGYGRRTTVIASLAVAKVSQTVAQVVFVIIGLAIVLDETALPAAVYSGILFGLVLFTALVIMLVLVQRRGMFAPLLRLAQRLRLSAHAPERMQRVQHLDAEIARLHVEANAPFLVSVACFFGGWCMGVVEVYLVLYFLGLPATLHLAIAIEVLAVAIDGMLFFVPMKAGTQEGSKVLIFTLLGLEPAKGLALGLLRRLRELTWALLGLAIASRQQLGSRSLGL